MDVDSDNESDNFSMTSRSVASSHTSYRVDTSMRSASPAPSVWAVDENLRSAAYKEVYGRGLNNYSDVYRLPADGEELERLDKQHEMLVDVMGTNYPPPMAAILADDVPGETKACLDLGCGSGSWIIDVARDFPHCSAVAVDLIPMQAPSTLQNLRSEVDDINLGLEHFYNDFNVVHIRLIASGIKDYHRLIDQVSRVLRPGGLIIVAEFDFHLYDKHRQRIELDTKQLGPPWWARWMSFVCSSMQASGGDVSAANHLQEWISSNPLFENVVYNEYWLPVISSPQDIANATEAQKQFLQIVAEDVKTFLRGSRPLLLGNGVPEDVVETLMSNAMKELEEAKIPQYTCLQYVYAQKKK